MKLARFRAEGIIRLGVVLDDVIFDLDGVTRLITRRSGLDRPAAVRDARTFLTQGKVAYRAAKKAGTWVKRELRKTPRIPAVLRGKVFDLDTVEILTPLSDPPKILCLARNYVSHARETSGDTPLPTSLLIFMKPATTLCGPGDPVIMPPDCSKLDHEVELAVVIGKRGRHIPVEKAMEHVGGYTILNDMSDRQYLLHEQIKSINWFYMKGQDTFAPLGPYLVLPDEIPDPHTLRLRLWVNEELRQDSSGEEMIFKVPEIIAQISRYVTLEPGDIIATGTPMGTSFSTKRYLKAGDIVECEIEGIGRLKNFIKVEERAYRTR